MSFCPANELGKYGWETGVGLGKSEQGIKEAIKVKLKFDTSGVGHDPGEQFTHHWWETAFNSAANNINVSENKDGVYIKKVGDCQISTKKNCDVITKKSMLYGSFLKAATLTDGTELQENHSNSDSSSDSDDPTEKSKGNEMLSDEQLFKVCGGRTAHKGARHGLKFNGKLARIAQQEASLAKSKGEESKAEDRSFTKEKNKEIIELNGKSKSKRDKARKKKKKSKRDQDCSVETNKPSAENFEKHDVYTPDGNAKNMDIDSCSTQEKRSKSKKRKRNILESASVAVMDHQSDIPTSINNLITSKKEKKKKRKKEK